MECTAVVPMPLASGPAVRLWGEMLGYGLAIGLSPVHIALLLLLLIGPTPLRRGSFLVGSWLLTSILTVTALLTLGHGMLLTMEMGTNHRTGLDLLAAGGLLALGLRELLIHRMEAEASGWSRRLDAICTLPLVPLLAFSTAVQLVSPDDLFLYAKSAGTLLGAGLDGAAEVAGAACFSLATSLLLLLPLLALLLGRDRVQPVFADVRSWLVVNGNVLVGSVSLLVAAYLGWQGIEGLLAR